MKKTFKNLIESLGLNYKKEIAFIVLVNILLLGALASLFIFLNNILYVVIGVVVIAVINLFLITRYSQMAKALDELHDNELINLLSYFEIFISNNKNVYNALSTLRGYSSTWMQDKIERLLKEIDEDKSVKPFINFSNNFSSKIIQSVMLSIYQMVDQGENSNSLNQFDSLFTQINNNLQIEKIRKKESSLESFNTYPLIGAGIISIILVFSVLLIMGDMINVI